MDGDAIFLARMPPGPNGHPVLAPDDPWSYPQMRHAGGLHPEPTGRPGRIYACFIPQRQQEQWLAQVKVKGSTRILAFLGPLPSLCSITTTIFLQFWFCRHSLVLIRSLTFLLGTLGLLSFLANRWNNQPQPQPQTRRRKKESQ